MLFIGGSFLAKVIVELPIDSNKTSPKPSEYEGNTNKFNSLKKEVLLSMYPKNFIFCFCSVLNFFFN